MTYNPFHTDIPGDFRYNKVSNRHGRVGVTSTVPPANQHSMETTAMADTIVPQKRCTKCGDLFPATIEFFYYSRKRDYLFAACKKCCNKQSRAWATNNPERVQEIQQRHIANNPDALKARKQRYRAKETTKQKEVQYRKRYQAEHGDIQRNAARNWSQRNKEYRRIQQSNYRARRSNLPNTFTVQNWSDCLSYFGDCCAVCERPFGEVSADHWIPLQSQECPGTIVTNIVPLCAGIDGCNNSKGSRDPYEWLVWKFGKRRANEINRRIQEYFNHVRQIAN